MEMPRAEQVAVVGVDVVGVDVVGMVTSLPATYTFRMFLSSPGDVKFTSLCCACDQRTLSWVKDYIYFTNHQKLRFSILY